VSPCENGVHDTAASLVQSNIDSQTTEAMGLIQSNQYGISAVVILYVHKAYCFVYAYVIHA